MGIILIAIAEPQYVYLSTNQYLHPMSLDPQRHQSILEEYKALREEIKHSSQVRFTIITISTSSWAGIAAWIVTNRSYFFAEIALVVLHVPIVIGYLLTRLSNRHIMRVSTYIREFIEPEIEGLRWETLVAEFQKNSKIVFSITLIAAGSLLLMSLGAFGLERVLEIPPLCQRIPYLDLVILGVFWVFIGGFHLPTILFEGSRSYEEAAGSLWKRIKDSQSKIQP